MVHMLAKKCNAVLSCSYAYLQEISLLQFIDKSHLQYGNL
jgi:hypothetical protein